MPIIPWGSEEDVVLTRLWIEGVEARAIADHPTIAANKRTRFAVISRAHRLHLPPHQGAACTSFAFQATERHASHRQAKPTKPPEPDLDDFEDFDMGDMLSTAKAPALGAVAAIAGLGPRSCRWPIGDPQLPDFHFCGKTKAPGVSYCPDCVAKAYMPPTPRKKVTQDTGPLVAEKLTV